MHKTQIIAIVIIALIISSCSTNSTTTNKEGIVKDSVSSTVKEIAKTKFGIEVKNYSIKKKAVNKNEFFSNILKNNGVSYPRVIEAVEASKDIFNVKYMRKGNTYYTFKTTDSTAKLDYLIYHLNKTNYIKFNFKDSIIATEHQLPIIIDTNIAEGIIESSPWSSLKARGYDPMLALELSDIYAWTIDFYGLQKGDRYKIIYEKRFVDSTYIGLGKVLACEFIHFDHNYKAYIFVQDSLEDYFDEEGGSLRRAFLKAPLRYSRISSRYSHSRLHPILKIRRPHHGVDYAAPTGTPVHTIGDGKVIYVGRKGGYGKYIKIKHNGTYTTGYAHLSRYAKGLKVGQFVKQGETIGYVGSTGRSTGPHLDFRVYQSGTPIDPLKMKSPPAVPIKDSMKLEFEKTINKYDNLLIL